MKCTDFENRIELLFDDNTPAEVRREMLEHLETCPACAEFYRQTKAAFNAVAPRVEVQAPAGLKARILKPPHKPKIRRQPHERPLRHGLGDCGSGRCPRR